MDGDSFTRSNATDPSPDDGLPDDLLQEIDLALSETLDGFREMEEPGEDAGIRQMQETFLELARQTLNPIGRYMNAISAGENVRDLLEISELVVTPLIPKVEAVGLREHADELSFFRSLLLLALGERDPYGTKAMREVVMEGFSKLSSRYQLKFRAYRLAVRNLVEFYRAVKANESVSEEDLRKFFAIGVPSLTWIRRTRVSEMSGLAGIEPDVMSQIRELAYQYRSVVPMSGARLAKEELKASLRPATLFGRQAGSGEDVADAAVESNRKDAPVIRGQA